MPDLTKFVDEENHASVPVKFVGGPFDASTHVRNQRSAEEGHTPVFQPIPRKKTVLRPLPVNVQQIQQQVNSIKQKYEAVKAKQELRGSTPSLKSKLAAELKQTKESLARESEARKGLEQTRQALEKDLERLRTRMESERKALAEKQNKKLEQLEESKAAISMQLEETSQKLCSEVSLRKDLEAENKKLDREKAKLKICLKAELNARRQLETILANMEEELVDLKSKFRSNVARLTAVLKAQGASSSQSATEISDVASQHSIVQEEPSFTDEIIEEAQAIVTMGELTLESWKDYVAVRRKKHRKVRKAKYYIESGIKSRVLFALFNNAHTTPGVEVTEA